MKKNRKNWRYILAVAQAAGILKQVPRTGWALKGVADVESVAEHSHRVAVLAMLLADTFGFERSKVVEMALIHDLGEAGIGDIKWERGKIVLVPPDSKHRDEGKVMGKIFEKLIDGKRFVNLWHEFTYQTSPEAKFVKQLDKLEMALQALEYEASGYSPELFEEFWENVEKYVTNKELDQMFRELRILRNQLDSNSKKSKKYFSKLLEK